MDNLSYFSTTFNVFNTLQSFTIELPQCVQSGDWLFEVIDSSINIISVTTNMGIMNPTNNVTTTYDENFYQYFIVQELDHDWCLYVNAPTNTLENGQISNIISRMKNNYNMTNETWPQILNICKKKESTLNKTHGVIHGTSFLTFEVKNTRGTYLPLSIVNGVPAFTVPTVWPNGVITTTDINFRCSPFKLTLAFTKVNQ